MKIVREMTIKEKVNEHPQPCDYGVRMEDLLPEGMVLEERVLDEMSLDPISAVEDEFPFKIVMMNPDCVISKMHAHILERGRGGKELGTFIITPNPPRTIDDLLPYEVGKHKGLNNIPPSWRQMIVDWARKRSRIDPLRTNWDCLLFRAYANTYLSKNGL